MSKPRISRHQLPDEFVKCAVPKDCPYMTSNGYCDEGPRHVKGNSDAACHRMSNKDLLGYLPSSISSTHRGSQS